MPGGSPNGGSGPPSGGLTPPTQNQRAANRKLATYEKTNTISYVASGGTTDASKSHQVLSIGRTTSATATPATDPRAIILTNTGEIPVVVMLGYETYVSSTVDITDTDTDGVFIHSLILPGESIEPALRSVISLQMETLTDPVATSGFADRSLWNLDGTVVDWTAPGTTLKQDSGADVKNNTLANTTDPVNFGVTVSASANSKYIRVGDLIRIENEIMEVLGTYEDDPTNSSLVEGDIRCKRGMYGSTNASHTDTPDVEFPYFNTRHEWDKYASAGYAQTDESGRYSSRNFFGLGRSDSTSPMGIVPGSACFRFHSKGYQEWGLQGINSSTNSGLSASTTYGFDLTVNGSGLLDSDTMQFTTDASNLNFGGTNGIIHKIQNVLDTQYYTTGSAIFEERVTVGIVNGDVRFTSSSNLSTSAILLAAPSAGETTPFGVGRIPAIGSIESPIPSTVPDGIDLVSYDPITYTQSTNSSILAFDRGNGLISGACTGTIDYETGKLNITSAPTNANFEYSVVHSSPFAGKVDSSEGSRSLGLVAVHANVLNRTMPGKLRVTLY